MPYFQRIPAATLSKIFCVPIFHLKIHTLDLCRTVILPVALCSVRELGEEDVWASHLKQKQETGEKCITRSFRICISHQMLSNKTEAKCDTYRARREMYTWHWLVNLKERDHLEDLGVGKIGPKETKVVYWIDLAH